MKKILLSVLALPFFVGINSFAQTPDSPNDQPVQIVNPRPDTTLLKEPIKEQGATEKHHKSKKKVKKSNAQDDGSKDPAPQKDLD